MGEHGEAHDNVESTLSDNHAQTTGLLLNGLSPVKTLTFPMIVISVVLLLYFFIHENILWS